METLGAMVVGSQLLWLSADNRPDFRGWVWGPFLEMLLEDLVCMCRVQSQHKVGGKSVLFFTVGRMVRDGTVGAWVVQEVSTQIDKTVVIHELDFAII